MKCKGVQPLLSAYLDRELDGKLMLEIREHLNLCSQCREESENLRSLKHLLCDLETVEPPAYLEQNLLATIHRERESRPKPVKVFAGALLFAGVAACSMFVTLIVLSNAPKPAATVHTAPSSIPFAIQRDQAFTGGSDPIGGTPLITAAAYGR